MLIDCRQEYMFVQPLSKLLDSIYKAEDVYNL